MGQTNFNGVIITNEYDVMNRLLAKGSVSGGYLASFAYNPTNGQRTNMADISGTNVYQYDERGDLTNKVVALAGGPTLSLNYAYSTNGSLLALWDGAANGVTNAYQYDVLGRLTNVLAGSGAVAGYGYDLVGNLQSTRYGNGVTNLCQYDSLNRLTNELWQTGGSPLANFAYALGATGNRTALNETVNGTGRTNLWVYDYLYRLTGETIGTASGTGTVGYGHDAVGNRTVRTSTIAQIPANSASYTTNDWLTTDGYDASGNTTNSGSIPYQYDALDHLTNVNSGQVLIAYDGDGNRVRKTVGGVTTYYLVDDRNPSGYAQVMEEWTNTGTGTGLSRVYNYGMDLVSQQQFGASPSTNYFVFDGHGSTRMLVSISGTVANTFAYDAFGILIASNSTPQTVYLYCGQQFDGDLGFYYLRARYMNPNTGRFWTMDTDQGDNEDPLSLHKFLYAEGSPVDNDDPLGLYSQEEGYAMERLIRADYTEAHPMADVSYGQWARIGKNPRLKPDILNKTDKTYADIKPLSLSGVIDGVEQLETYDDSLKSLKYKREQWPANSIAPLRTVFYNFNPYFYFNVDGIIFYTRINLSYAAIPISIPAARALAVKQAAQLANGAATTFEEVVGTRAAYVNTFNSTQLEEDMGDAEVFAARGVD